VLEWGDPGFREAFRQIGFVLARLPSNKVDDIHNRPTSRDKRDRI
jgi:hypothetical protein